MTGLKSGTFPAHRILTLQTVCPTRVSPLGLLSAWSAWGVSRCESEIKAEEGEVGPKGHDSKGESGLENMLSHEGMWCGGLLPLSTLGGLWSLGVDEQLREGVLSIEDELGIWASLGRKAFSKSSCPRGNDPRESAQ